MVKLVAEVVEEPEVNPSGTAAFPASPTFATMVEYVPSAAAPTVAALSLKVSSVVAPAVVHTPVVTGVEAKPLGSVPV
jgi:hypothetical protein